MVHLTPAKSISVGQAGECYVGLKKLEDCEDLFPEDKISSIAKYTVKEMAGDVVKRTYEDEFSLDDFHIKLATYMSPWPIESSEFIRTWEQMKGV